MRLLFVAIFTVLAAGGAVSVPSAPAMAVGGGAR
jgi:hypothetical protein